MTVVKVGMADAGVAQAPEVIRTCGLGSCVGISLWDPVTKIGGLAHVMLPSSGGQTQGNPYKYADTAIPLLVQKMQEKGAQIRRIVAKIAGGAQMFAFSNGNELMRIGPRNVEAVEQSLQLLQIPILARDVGGNSGRTVELQSEDGVFVIRNAKQGVFMI